MLKKTFRRGTYFDIQHVAKTAGSSPEAVIAAARVCGVVRVGGYLWFSGGKMPLDFAEELVLARDAERAAAQRRERATRAPAGSPLPPKKSHRLKLRVPWALPGGFMGFFKGHSDRERPNSSSHGSTRQPSL